MTRAGTIPLSEIEWIKIHFNTRRRKSNKAGLQQLLTDTGGDLILNAAIFLWSGKPCCHLKADGVVKCKPDYGAWAISWDSPADFSVIAAPNNKANYMACVKCIIDGKKPIKMDYQPDMKYPCNRTAVGIKDGRFAYYCTEDNLEPEDLQERLFNAGWHDAIMMDGGGSACCMDSDGNGFAGDGRYIPFYLVVKLKGSKAVCPHSEPTKNIRKGSIGSGAKWVQWHLNQRGANLTVDGIFGSKSVEALIAFQKSVFTNPSDWDGICGPATRTKLKL